MFEQVQGWFRRYLGEVIIAGAGFHTVSGLLSSEGSFADLVRDGWFGSMNPGYAPVSGETFWFTFTGVALLGAGFLTRSHLRATGTMPASFGLILTIAGLLISTAMPASGGWLILGAGLVALTLHRPVGRTVTPVIVSIPAERFARRPR